ncbi:MAG TPA: hypothetical protein VHM91_09850 [Verrucomicrobiales bacterium]|jgi:hypothetical protein|nr:hypothetical protein [Verrucomicrobiales bacterium]
MLQFELYVPLTGNSGELIEEALLEVLKKRLRDRFGGFTYFPQESEGEWETGGHRFRDRIVILRVLSGEEDAREWFKDRLEQFAREFGQNEFLITATSVETLDVAN